MTNESDFFHNPHLPLNSTGGNGGYYIHTLRTLFQRDGRFKEGCVTDMMKGRTNTNPVAIMSWIVENSPKSAKYLLSGIFKAKTRSCAMGSF